MFKNAASDTGRVGYFDIAKGIGIILVVIGHIEYVPAPIRFYIVTFHMPLFFIVSGMLMSLTDEKNRDLKGLLIKKLKRIMLPYLVFSVLYPIIDIVYYYVTGNGDPFGSLKTNIMDTMMLYGYSVLWFLPTAFFSEIIFLMVIKGSGRVFASIKKDRPDNGKMRMITESLADVASVVICFILALIMYYTLGKDQNHFILSLVRFFISAFLVSVGSLLHKIFYRKKTGAPVKAILSLVLFGILLMFHGRNGIVDMHFGVYGNIYLFLLNAVMGSLAVILLSMSLEGIKGCIPCRMLIFYGINSLFVMITHINFYVLYFSEVFSFKVVEYVKHAKSLVFNVMTVACVLIAEYIMIRIWQKIRFIFVKKP